MQKFYLLGVVLAVGPLAILPASANPPSFNCVKATYPDEYAICASAELSQLDNIANAGYQYVRRVFGNQYAKSITLPLLNLRRACGSNSPCIKVQQLAAIQKFRSLGAPINDPQATDTKAAPTAPIVSAMADDPTVEMRTCTNLAGTDDSNLQNFCKMHPAGSAFYDIICVSRYSKGRCLYDASCVAMHSDVKELCQVITPETMADDAHRTAPRMPPTSAALAYNLSTAPNTPREHVLLLHAWVSALEQQCRPLGLYYDTDRMTVLFHNVGVRWGDIEFQVGEKIEGEPDNIIPNPRMKAEMSARYNWAQDQIEIGSTVDQRSRGEAHDVQALCKKAWIDFGPESALKLLKKGNDQP